jgi:hypothetical protein
MPAKKEPLPADQLDKLRQAVSLLDQVDQVAAQATDCGFDCRAHQALSQALRQRAYKMQQHFGGVISPS